MTAENSNLLSDLAKHLDKAGKEGFLNPVIFKDPRGKTVAIAFNKQRTQAKVFYETQNGSIIPQIEPSKVFASKKS